MSRCVFATQSLADIQASSIAPAIIESCPQRIFLPNDRAIEPQARAAYERFGLNARQIELIARATPKRDYYLQSRRGNRLFDLALGRIALALCGSSDPGSQRLIDRLLEDRAPDELPRPLSRSARPRLGRRASRPISSTLRAKENDMKTFIAHLDCGAFAPSLLCGTALAVPTAPAAAQIAVFDGTNYAQNLLQAARALNQINNQIKSLQNEASMLQNMANNLQDDRLSRSSSASTSAMSRSTS